MGDVTNNIVKFWGSSHVFRMDKAMRFKLGRQADTSEY